MQRLNQNVYPHKSFEPNFGKINQHPYPKANLNIDRQVMLQNNPLDNSLRSYATNVNLNYGDDKYYNYENMDPMYERYYHGRTNMMDNPGREVEPYGPCYKYYNSG